VLFGHDGNGASVEAVTQWAGISTGTIINWTHRVMIAFLALHDSTICWPSEEEKEEAKEWVESVSCYAWRDRFCIVDRMATPLFQKPGYHSESYFHRKCQYSLNVQVQHIVFNTCILTNSCIQLITLPNLCIIDYVVGRCRSVHNSTIFCDSWTHQNSGTLFNSNE
jgi:hypothetical protein